MTPEEIKIVEKVAETFAAGLINTLMKIFVIGFIALTVISIPLKYLMPTDDCDKSWHNRCGMSVKTDNLTGQQYLVTPEGHITPRLGVK